MKIAIVGSGLAGLTAAYCLGDDHEVHLYERHGEGNAATALYEVCPRVNA